MSTTLKALVASALTAAALTAQAGVITIGGQALTNADRTEDFQSLAPGSNVMAITQSGLAISTIGTQGISVVNSPNCRNNSGGMSNKYLALGISHQCLVQQYTVNGVSFRFGDDVSELSWTGLGVGSFGGYTIQALKNGAVVSETIFNLDNRFQNKTVLFSGSVFDEIRLMEASTWGGYLAIDNMAWNFAPPAEVPLPGTLALLGIGMLGMGMKRKSKQKE